MQQFPRNFQEAARVYREHGAVAIPVRPDESRKPYMGWQYLGRALADATIDRLADKYPDAATAIVCGPSRLTVVDLDTPDMIHDDRPLGIAIAKFGETPLIVGTPKGGVHLYYASSGEPSTNLRNGPLAIDGDIRGTGGIITAPPTVRGYGPNQGKPYVLISGSVADLPHLPKVKPGVLDYLQAKSDANALNNNRKGSKSAHAPTGLDANASYPENALFNAMRPLAFDGATIDELIYFGRETAAADVSYRKIVETARNVHLWCRDHEDWRRGSGNFSLPNDVVNDLIGTGDPFVLFTAIARAFGGKPGSFPVSDRAMAEGGTIEDWGRSRQRYRRATKVLVERGYLVVVHVGRGPGDPTLFQFGPRTPARLTGPDLDRNLTKSPYPPPPQPVV